jgi:hypothetical protein
MPRVGFEPTIPESRRAKQLPALDRPVTVIVDPLDYMLYILLKACTVHSLLVCKKVIVSLAVSPAIFCIA